MSAPLPLVRIRAPRRWEALDLRALWRFRDLLWALAARDITLRYRQTVLGVLWVVLQPLLGAGIFAFVFGRVAQLDSGGAPYFLFSFAGLLAWNAFSATVLKSATSLVSNAGLVSKVFFPRLVLPFSTTVSTLADFGIAFTLGLALLLAHDRTPGFAFLALPLWLALLLLLALGLGLFCAGLAVSYRDVVHILPVGLQLLLYASPVGYALTAIPEGLPRTLYSLNPLAALIEGFRASLLGGIPPDARSIALAVVFTLTVFVAGLFAFRRMERQFADVI